MSAFRIGTDREPIFYHSGPQPDFRGLEVEERVSAATHNRVFDEAASWDWAVAGGTSGGSQNRISCLSARWRSLSYQSDSELPQLFLFQWREMVITEATDLA